MPPKSSSSVSVYLYLVLTVELFWRSTKTSAHQWPNWTAAGLAVTKDMDQLGQMCAVSLVPSAWTQLLMPASHVYHRSH